MSDPAAALDRHIADSLSALEIPALVEAGQIADVGAGPGFPGLALAIALPDAQVDLIESTSRKTAVIGRLIAAGRLENARVVTARAEDWAHEAPAAYDVVTARAVAALPVLVEYAAPLLVPTGTLVAWKGVRDADEEAAGTKAASLLGLTPSEICPVRPFRGSQLRHLVTYTKTSPTPARFPRRAGMATKRPLA